MTSHDLTHKSSSGNTQHVTSQVIGQILEHTPTYFQQSTLFALRSTSKAFESATRDHLFGSLNLVHFAKKDPNGRIVAEWKKYRSAPMERRRIRTSLFGTLIEKKQHVRLLKLCHDDTIDWQLDVLHLLALPNLTIVTVTDAIRSTAETQMKIKTLERVLRCLRFSTLNTLRFVFTEQLRSVRQAFFNMCHARLQPLVSMRCHEPGQSNYKLLLHVVNNSFSYGEPGRENDSSRLQCDVTFEYHHSGRTTHVKRLKLDAIFERDHFDSLQRLLFKLLQETSTAPETVHIEIDPIVNPPHLFDEAEVKALSKVLPMMIADTRHDHPLGSDAFRGYLGDIEVTWPGKNERTPRGLRLRIFHRDSSHPEKPSVIQQQIFKIVSDLPPSVVIIFDTLFGHDDPLLPAQFMDLCAKSSTRRPVIFLQWIQGFRKDASLRSWPIKGASRVEVAREILTSQELRHLQRFWTDYGARCFPGAQDPFDEPDNNIS